MTVSEDFLRSANRQFLYYKTLGEKAMAQLEAEQLFISLNEDTNSIAVIVKHLHGNMMSRWTDFLTTDGEKEWRNRDGEFEEDTSKFDVTERKAELLKTWNDGWDCLFTTLNSLKPEDLSRIIYIRNEGHTALEAINRQLAHYPYHIGQIVFYAKLLKKSDWESLSIPKNKSKEYNDDKFSQDKSRKHFTDEELKKLK
ncbi:MAG: hypothetical protein K0S53_1525 [Bacteroidetes bacterium]|jgi:hypothetical protein|nr:hypothetical protein [Bacteroidota bacterium]MDF2453237.1 hypothetical protein [Bacteroidota bacterium]